MYLHPPSCKLKIFNMTVDIHVSQSKIFILNGSRSTDVNTKYQQQQTNNLNFISIFSMVNKPLSKVAVYIGFIQDRGKNN